MISRLLQTLACLWLSASWSIGGVIVINTYQHAAPPSPPPTGDPEFIAYGVSNGTTYALPSGTASGDFMVAWVGCASNSFSTPSGWTQSVAPALWSAANGYYAACYSKVAGGSEPSSYTFATGSFRIGCILTYRNASAVDAVGSIQDCGTDTTPDLTGITSSSGAMLLALLFNRTGALLTITPPTGMTERVDEMTASFWQMTAAELLDADSSTRTFTQSSSPFGSGGLLIAIQ